MTSNLSHVPIFAGLDDKALEVFLERSTRKTVGSGELLAREGEANNCMFIIEDGEVQIIKNLNSPKPVPLATLGPGEFFGEMCILETLPRSASAKATRETAVVSISSISFFHLYQKMPAQYSILVLNIARDLSRRLRRLDEAFAARH